MALFEETGYDTRFAIDGPGTKPKSPETKSIKQTWLYF